MLASGASMVDDQTLGNLLRDREPMIPFHPSQCEIDPVVIPADVQTFPSWMKNTVALDRDLRIVPTQCAAPARWGIRFFQNSGSG